MTQHAKNHTYRLSSPDEILERASAFEWIVDGLIPAYGISLLAGAPFAGKSRTAASIAAHVSLGVPWCGLETQSRRVAWLGTDRGEIDAAGTLRLAVAGLPGAGVSIVDPSTWLATEVANVDAIRELLDSEGIGLLVIDCLRASHREEENSSSIRPLVMQPIQQIAEVCPVLLVHHAGHEATRARGSSDIPAACTTTMLLTGNARALRLKVTSHLRLPFTIDLSVAGGEGEPYRYSLADEQGRRATDETAELQRIAAIVRGRRGILRGELLDAIGGNATRRRDHLKEAIASGLVVEVRSGATIEHYPLDHAHMTPLGGGHDGQGLGGTESVPKQAGQRPKEAA